MESHKHSTEATGDAVAMQPQERWETPTLETIPVQRLVAVLASCTESRPSATFEFDGGCSNDCP